MSIGMAHAAFGVMDGVLVGGRSKMCKLQNSTPLKGPPRFGILFHNMCLGD